jgi:hypothetical protein
MPERSMRRIDPLATLASFPLTVAAACAAPFLAVLLTSQHLDDIDSAFVMFVAIVVLVVACVLLVVHVMLANAVRRQFSAFAHSVIVVLGVLAALLAAVAQWRSNELLRDDWGPLAVGVLLLGLAPYRPIRSLFISAAGAAFVIGGLAAVQAQQIGSAAPTMAYVVLAVVPVLAPAAAGIAYAVAAVQSRERWQRMTEEVARANASNLRDPIARSVQHERVALLEREVVPFFTSVLQQVEITPADTARAHNIAKTVRGIMVVEANRSWIGATVDEVADRAGVERGYVSDTERLSDRMSFGQRAAVRALLDALLTDPGFEPASFSAAVTASGSRSSVRITATLHEKPRGLSRTVAPYLAVIRAVFLDLEVTVRSSDLTLRFSYEH